MGLPQPQACSQVARGLHKPLRVHLCPLACRSLRSPRRRRRQLRRRGCRNVHHAEGGLVWKWRPGTRLRHRPSRLRVKHKRLMAEVIVVEPGALEIAPHAVLKLPGQAVPSNPKLLFWKYRDRENALVGSNGLLMRSRFSIRSDTCEGCRLL
jgi:hypothetical protein